MAQRDDDCIILTTGKRIYAHRGIVGINEELDTHEGYDGTIDVLSWPNGIWLCCEERRELAAYAISLWQKFSELDDDYFLSEQT